MLRHWDGSSWTTGDLPEFVGSDEYLGVTCRDTGTWLQDLPDSPDDTLFRRTGGEWKPITFPTARNNLGGFATGGGNTWVLGGECLSDCDDWSNEVIRRELWYIENDVATPTMPDALRDLPLSDIWTTDSGRTFLFGDGMVLEHVE
jgi:hypothetical protein